MAHSDDEPLGGDDFDLDRVVIDADYRRRVLHRLRQQRLGAESALRMASADAARAIRPGD